MREVIEVTRAGKMKAVIRIASEEDIVVDCEWLKTGSKGNLMRRVRFNSPLSSRAV